LGPRVPAPIELGAEFVHERPAITDGLLREFGATLVDGSESGFVFRDGALHAAPDDDGGSRNSCAVPCREDLASPVDGVVWFAGEATAAGGEGGTVAGALQSGMRATREVLGC
jgi:hypothetical protein